MNTKGAFFSIAVILVLSFLVGFGNADTTLLSESLAAISKEKIFVIEKSISDELSIECVADTAFCYVADTGFCLDPKPGGFSILINGTARGNSGRSLIGDKRWLH